MLKRVQGSPSHHEAPKQFAIKPAMYSHAPESTEVVTSLHYHSGSNTIESRCRTNIKQKVEQTLSLFMYWSLWEHNGNLLVMQERPDQAGKLSPCVII